MTKVSTITPCYNMSKYMKGFLDNLSTQTHKDLEIVLDHNDPSDEEVKLVEEYNDEYDNILHIKVEGVDPIGTSMNRCIEYATGEYLCIWNVDDLRTPDSIEVMAKALDENPDVDFVYGIENDYEKSHVITDFIKKGFETGVIDMITDGQEERQFLYAQDCCEALETVMNNYGDFKSDDELHVTSFTSIKIIDIANIIKQKFEMIGKNVEVKPSIDIDTVQQNSKNVASNYLTNWWKPTTSLEDGIAKVFASMKKNYD